jgi:hypothetical protein
VFVAHLLVLRWYDDAEKMIDLPGWWMHLPAGPKDREAPKGSRRTRIDGEAREGPGPTTFIPRSGA